MARNTGTAVCGRPHGFFKRCQWDIDVGINLFPDDGHRANHFRGNGNRALLHHGVTRRVERYGDDTRSRSILPGNAHVPNLDISRCFLKMTATRSALPPTGRSFVFRDAHPVLDAYPPWSRRPSNKRPSRWRHTDPRSSM